jgi:hypothetical protein
MQTYRPAPVSILTAIAPELVVSLVYLHQHMPLLKVRTFLNWSAPRLRCAGGECL